MFVLMFVPVSTIPVRAVAIRLRVRCHSGSMSGLGATPLSLSKNCPERECLSHSPFPCRGSLPGRAAARLIPAGRLLGADGTTRVPVLVAFLEDPRSASIGRPRRARACGGRSSGSTSKRHVWPGTTGRSPRRCAGARRDAPAWLRAGSRSEPLMAGPALCLALKCGAPYRDSGVSDMAIRFGEPATMAICPPSRTSVRKVTFKLYVNTSIRVCYSASNTGVGLE